MYLELQIQVEITLYFILVHLILEHREVLRKQCFTDNL